MVRDRHDRLAKALKHLNHSRSHFWSKECASHPNYCLTIRPVVPLNMLECYSMNRAGRSRSIAALIYWIALINLLKKDGIDSNTKFFIGNVLGFPEKVIQKKRKYVQRSLLRNNLIVPFTVIVEYQDQKNWLDEKMNMSWILSFNEIDLAIPGCFNVREKKSEFENTGAWKKATNWTQQTQNESSKLFKNRDLLARKAWEIFVSQNQFIPSKPGTITNYPFKPEVGQTIGQSLICVQEFINNTTSNHYKKIAKQWLQFIIKTLFANTHLTLKQEATILERFGVHHPSYVKTKSQSLILELSAYPIDHQRMVKYLDALSIEFLEDPEKNEFSGTLILIILICLQASHRKERAFSASNILNLTRTNWISNNRSFVIHNQILAVSCGLASLVDAFISMGKKQNRKLFNISRSWINEHLKKINTSLGYDWDNDPVTLQTFIARPTHDWIGKRCKPLLWNLASKIHRHQRRIIKVHEGKNYSNKIRIFKKQMIISNINKMIRFQSNFPHQKITFKAFKMINLG